MFYDLENPASFVENIYENLDKEGIFVFEVSYMPEMLKLNSFDTICHEHLEYYSFAAINYILARAGMRLIDATLNSVNGGSMAISAVKSNSAYQLSERAKNLLAAESEAALEDPETYNSFIQRCDDNGQALLSKLDELKSAGLLRKGQILGGIGESSHQDDDGPEDEVSDGLLDDDFLDGFVEEDA